MQNRQYMKLSIIKKNKEISWELDQLLTDAKKRNIETEVVDFTTINQLEKQLENIGDVIFWRSASADTSLDKNIILSILQQMGKIIINNTLISKPYLPYKTYQYKLLNNLTGLSIIPTWNFKSKEELIQTINAKELAYPIIQKPYLGGFGENISLIKNESELNKVPKKIQSFIYQPFIPNNGDFRIMMVDKKALGVIKRTAQEGNFLNNVSQGGSANLLEDSPLRKQLIDSSKKITNIFNLDFTGVDIIENQDTHELFFMELNTKPQWQGFQTTSNINIGNKILDLCKKRYDFQQSS